MSPAPTLPHRRTHNLLLISKLLSLAQPPHAQPTSPFTLLLDTLEQPARPLLTREYLRRAGPRARPLSSSSSRAGSGSASVVVVVFLGFETFAKPDGVDYFVPCYGFCGGGEAVGGGGMGGPGRSGGMGEGVGERIAREVGEILRQSGGKRFLIMIDSLTTLASLSIRPTSNLNLTAFLSSLLQPPGLQIKGLEQDQGPQISLVAVYHTDVPLPSPPPSALPPAALLNSYSPSPLSLLSYLATTIITIHSLPILLAEKSARSKSLAAPSFGLSEEVDGVVIGLKPKSLTKLNQEERGIVLELEHRRRSGRGVREWFFLPASRNATKKGEGQPFQEIVTLLDDHPLFRRSEEETSEELSDMTFNLALTERQRLEREGVVLPYFDAQKAGGGAGEGGRILYDMGVEDDFDEEEDEI
ncbi:uncharacterized protein Z519_09945 [Cladophialophora bantiana CBS 173.52]|uniref:Elongator complex protein 5 n=1 Tax=Cladophialophora bantiana (strain ATCC 10958 / CBS 173.52 / CDC B-1940 / NIH 8579) TaxID=1442370 RepID=A0A0D2H933_CLAB1|nr:uncharacterized protein Z519_09945 [Cladophialophora bantiana CBS 173.52]KIW89788.1 hypothetical protein Z519_09945 [Cladophialophora bantiana CBS 173.52]